MPKAWIENGNIFVTDDETLSPSNAIDVPIGVTSSDLKIVDGSLVLKSEEEKLEEFRNEKLFQLKQYTYSLLSSTDWIVIKCSELGIDISQEYPQIKELRDRIRSWCNQLEQQILSGTSVEELTQIKIEFSIV